MAKTRGGRTLSIGRQLVQREEGSIVAPKPNRRSNRLRQRLGTDIGVSSQSMKHRGKTSKGPEAAG